jgi:hypothetical protein
VDLGAYGHKRHINSRNDTLYYIINGKSSDRNRKDVRRASADIGKHRKEAISRLKQRIERLEENYYVRKEMLTTDEAAR